MFVKKNDKVKVIAGKDKGTEGVVEQVIPAANRVVRETGPAGSSPAPSAKNFPKKCHGG